MVLPAEEIHSLDIEVADRLAEIADLSLGIHLHSRQTLDCILQGIVSRFSERAKEVGKRIRPLNDRVGLHRHLLQL